jgi:hypothetical protein
MRAALGLRNAETGIGRPASGLTSSEAAAPAASRAAASRARGFFISSPQIVYDLGRDCVHLHKDCAVGAQSERSAV